MLLARMTKNLNAKDRCSASRKLRVTFPFKFKSIVVRNLNRANALYIKMFFVILKAKLSAFIPYTYLRLSPMFRYWYSQTFFFFSRYPIRSPYPFFHVDKVIKTNSCNDRNQVAFVY